MPNLEREVTDTAKDLRAEHKSLTEFEALQIAVRIQHNRVLEEAYLVGRDAPVALERIAMELGADDENSIKGALNYIASALSEIQRNG